MKVLTSITFVLFSILANAQLLSGSLVDEGRKMTSNSTFVIEDSHEGAAVFELAVDREGKVTSAKLISDGTTVVSTPARIKARSHVMGYTFTPGTHFPQFQHVRVKVTLVAPKPVIQSNQQ